MAINGLMTYLSKGIQVRDVKFVHNLHSSLKFVLLKFRIDIFDSFKIMRFSATQQFCNFKQLFYPIFRLKLKF